MRRIWQVVGAVAILALASACGSEEEPGADEDAPVESIAIDTSRADEANLGFEMPVQETRAAHIDYSTDPAQLTLITWGSSTCPEYPTNITWSNATTLAIASSTDYGDVACTMDLVSNAAVVEVPPNQDSSEAETVVLNGDEIELINGAD